MGHTSNSRFSPQKGVISSCRLNAFRVRFFSLRSLLKQVSVKVYTTYILRLIWEWLRTHLRQTFKINYVSKLHENKKSGTWRQRFFLLFGQWMWLVKRLITSHRFWYDVNLNIVRTTCKYKMYVSYNLKIVHNDLLKTLSFIYINLLL